MNGKPKVSIIVPIFNRSQFLSQLVRSIESQTFKDFELIVIDDGSDDNPEGALQKHAQGLQWRYFYQSNAGPYAARNLGLAKARGEYIAFQDSDDEWPPYHLEELVSALDSNDDVDWVFGSICRIDHETGQIIDPDNFRTNGRLHPFVGLKVEDRDGLKVIADSRITEIAILYQVPGSTQCALIRSSVFDSNNFDESYRTGFDRFFAIRCTKLGYGFAFVDRTHQIYHVHDDHISLVSSYSPEKLEKNADTMLRGYRELKTLGLSGREMKALRRKMASVYAWEKAASYRQRSMNKEELKAMFAAFKLVPIKYAKPTLSSFLRYLSSGFGAVRSS